MAEVIWLDEALDDLRNIIRYVEQFDEAAAHDIGIRLYDLGQSLEHFPRRGRPLEDGTRELVTEPPYIVGYEVDGEIVFVRSIRHGRRRPLP